MHRRSCCATIAVLFNALFLFGQLSHGDVGQTKPTYEAKESLNLARRARVSASSRYNDQYDAAFAVDGSIPEPQSMADAGRAWAVHGPTSDGKAFFALEWDPPVMVAEIIYYGRTAFCWKENWADCQVFLGDETNPVVVHRLREGHGPQRLSLPQAVQTSKVTLRFLSSYHGPNPGASEIEVYASAPEDSMLGKFLPPCHIPTGPAPRAPLSERVPERPALSGELHDRIRSGDMGFHELVVIRRHHIECSHVYTYHCEGQRDGGGLYVYDLSRGELREILSTPNGQISSCDLSHDGQRLLFSWRQDQFYQVFLLHLDGSGLTQLTAGSHHNYDACWLPDGDIAFLSTRCPQAAYCFFTPVGILYRMKSDGSEQQRLSANYLNDFTPTVLQDGRILYGRWEYVDRPAIPIQSLWTLSPDGTRLSVFFGNRVLDPATFIEPQEIPGSTRVLCTLTGHNGSCRGAIGIIDPSLGVNAQQGIINVTPDIPLQGIHISTNGPIGPYQTPYPLDDRYFLVSYDGTILVRDYAVTEQAVVLAPKEDLGFYNPRPVRSRPLPMVQGSSLPESSEGYATLFVQDVYQGLEPTVRRGEVKRICVVEELPRRLIDSPGIQRPAFDFQRVAISCGATYVPKRVWGFARVHEDGSAFFQVPAQRPIYFLALDAQGRTVQRMRSFTHLMPGEIQGCLGCHEPRHQSTAGLPPPRAMEGKAQALEPPSWGVAGFCYASLVQPVLDRRCVGCHGREKPAKEVDLTGDKTDYFNMSYEMLARGRVILREGDGNEVSIDNPYTKWIPTYNGQEWNIQAIEPKIWGSPVSPLADLILDGHPDERGVSRISLTRDEKERILLWIDLNVPYYGTADTAHPTLQACRRMVPEELDATLGEVASRRCTSCHGQGIPRRPWLRLDHPEFNDFLRAPLSRESGGTQACGQAVFESKEDADYQAVLRTFLSVGKLMRETPRMDMLGAPPERLDMATRDLGGRDEIARDTTGE